ncbi:unnamed protein product [Vicia faba]|uniref:Secreted protein n=1 Tax=Vicia faba TaxID=3906 RepID=A0AAV1A364_VICFA|nr:unnamed protein product [Vicia faba]
MCHHVSPSMTSLYLSVTVVLSSSMSCSPSQSSTAVSYSSILLTIVHNSPCPNHRPRSLLSSCIAASTFASPSIRFIIVLFGFNHSIESQNFVSIPVYSEISQIENQRGGSNAKHL